MDFKLLKVDQLARRGQLSIKGKIVQTPAFVPMAPLSHDSCLTPYELASYCQIEMVNVDLIHLLWRYKPSLDHSLIPLHTLFAWNKSIIAHLDQAKSLQAQVVSVKPRGLEIRSPVDGKITFYTPHDYIKLQLSLAADILVSFHYPYIFPSYHKKADKYAQFNLEWANICNRLCLEGEGEDVLLLAPIPIMGTHPLAEGYLDGLLAQEFMGYSLEWLDHAGAGTNTDFLPLNLIERLEERKPRYLRLSSEISSILESIAAGIDIIQSPMPLHKAYLGELFTSEGIIQISDNEHSKLHKKAINNDCKCYTCLHFSRAYLHYLQTNHIMLGKRLNTIHNVYFFQELMLNIRSAIEKGCFKQIIGELKRLFNYQSNE